MMVSGFGMCCGYYQKIIDRKISVEDFYKKRYIKIWPYFALLCALDFVFSPSKESLFEVFANLTLCQGLLPNAKISVIGVSWTLAVIFVFYMLFPFFCFLIGNKKRAWVWQLQHWCSIGCVATTSMLEERTSSTMQSISSPVA